jgi:hypothetical protein
MGGVYGKRQQLYCMFGVFCLYVCNESIGQTIEPGKPFAIFQKDSLQQSKDIISDEKMFYQPFFHYFLNESHDL